MAPPSKTAPRPRSPQRAPSPAPLLVIIGVIILVTVPGGVWAIKRLHQPDLALQTVTAQRGASPAEIAAATREVLLRAGASADGMALRVVVDQGEPPAEDQPLPPRTARVEARWNVAVLGFAVARSGVVSVTAQALQPGIHEGDGRPAAQDPTAARLEQTLSAARCPPGTIQRGAPPPKGLESWCQEEGGNADKPVMHGPYFGWHKEGPVAEEGTYNHGRRHGKWTRYFKDGQKEAEAWYKDGVQHGRFRQWDASGAVTMDMDYVDGKPARR